MDNNPKIKITSEMIDAGADVLLGELGGGELFSAPDLAEWVYRAMARQKILPRAHASNTS